MILLGILHLLATAIPLAFTIGPFRRSNRAFDAHMDALTRHPVLHPFGPDLLRAQQENKKADRLLARAMLLASGCALVLNLCVRIFVAP